MCVIEYEYEYEYEYDFISSREERLKRRCPHVYRQTTKKDTKLNPHKARRRTRFDNKCQ